MTKAHKVSVVVLFLVSVVFFIMTTGIVAIKEKEKQTRIEIEGKLTQTQEEKKQVEADLSDANQKIDDLSDKLEYEKNRAAALAEDIAREREENKRLSQELTNKESQIGELKEVIEDKKNELASLGQEKEELGIKLAKLEEEKSELEGKIKEYESQGTVDLGPIEVTPQKIQLEGTVLAVNKEFNFVIVDLGAKDKINKGKTLIVYRGDTLIGKIELDRIYEDMSSANILPEWKQADIKVGDRVKAL